ncbi:AP2-like ethylene-responsive transcription factor CRL5 [Magnolia sinica]|uniref:AP2-like ethylene-responsive transcription factor CRL5 n=1 Tax=Magnolia sinica TaxID=86752 RepID=UPI00265AD9F5|nr:AP2-like ethylene-responsive transcription factor CRL5 [Magnolia sinica]XP_058112860.1 AP2-like ethylene-responsive transcription factor CRL5 [Magnolia sinica]XP_058112861.1 AP2-like ethylene-responsive transcription factor CRL5 [Magnolia sinica]
MKGMNDNDNDNNNWLGFSLSPHMNMDASTDPHLHHHHYHHRHQHHHHYHQTQAAAAVSPAVPTSFFVAPPQMKTQGGALYSQLSVMPLKSDGNLCIMEALTRSQQGEGVMPKLKSPELSESSLYRYSREVIAS